MKATKIVCTLGPASSDVQVMKEMLLAGMNVARLNCSHGSHEEHLERINTFRDACNQVGVPAAILLDTKGPEIRLGTFPEDKVLLKKGQQFVLYGSAEVPGSAEGVGISCDALAAEVKPGTKILVDDGKIRMTAKEVRNGDIICEVMDEGYVSTKKGVNVPDVHLPMDYLSERDQADLLFGIRNDIDFVAASFVRTAEDVEDVRRFLDENGGSEIRIISKIENPEGIREFDKILDASDGIMIARGDMGVEVDYATLPGIQKKIIRLCRQKGKPVITATQMLESMVSEPTPTRAEITDVANAVFDGTSAVMLSGESAAGKYPSLAVSVMTRIVEQAEKELSDMEVGTVYISEEADVSTAIGHAACQAANDIGAKALIAVTYSGYTARMMSRFYPKQPIIAATPLSRTARQMGIIRGVIPVMTQTETEFDQLTSAAIGKARENGLIDYGDRVVISAGLPLNSPGTTNLIKVETV
ncbi:MAG: pyruvate kinase [Firmicutes bacterium]|nr:pyruvate kinase [Bacillota bacterium]